MPGGPRHNENSGPSETEQFVKPGVVGGVTALGVPAEQKSDALHVYADGLGAFGVGEPSDVKET